MSFARKREAGFSAARRRARSAPSSLQRVVTSRPTAVIGTPDENTISAATRSRQMLYSWYSMWNAPPISTMRGAVPPDVVLLVQHVERAAHQHNARYLGPDIRAALERQRDIGERADGHQGHWPRRGHQCIDDESGGAAVRGLGNRIRIREHFKLPRAGGAHGIEQRLGSARGDRD